LTLIYFAVYAPARQRLREAAAIPTTAPDPHTTSEG